MNKAEFVEKYGMEVYNELWIWNRKPSDVRVYDNLSDIEKDYDMKLNDAEDVFREFGEHVRAVVNTGVFLIDKNYTNVKNEIQC